MSDIGTHERMLANWRNKEAQAEALRQFRDTGGQHRIRITTDNENAVIEKLIDAMMDGNGFLAIINSAVKKAENNAAEAKRDFMKGKTPQFVNVGPDGRMEMVK